MDKIYQLEGAYLIASPSVSHEMLRGSLIYLYQIDDDLVSGIIVNKPFKEKKIVEDFLAYPKTLSEHPVWQGGPVATDRLIAFCDVDNDIYITDRLTNLSEAQKDSCMVVVGQCVWDTKTLSSQIRSGDWMLVGSQLIIPAEIPAALRIEYVLRRSGISMSRYVHANAEVVT